jgi:hypothetical protein
MMLSFEVTNLLSSSVSIDGDAHRLTTEDSDLRLLGETYQRVPIVN